MNEYVYDKAGRLLTSTVYDLDTGTVTTTDQGKPPAISQADPAILGVLRSNRDADSRRDRLDKASATLREWAADAAKVDVGPMTASQQKVLLQTVVTRLGVFFDRFADLLDER